MHTALLTTLTVTLVCLGAAANVIVEDTTFSTADWFYASANDNPSLTGGDTLVFDAGVTNATTAEDDPFVYRPFANTAIDLGKVVVVEFDIALNDYAPNFHRALSFGFYAMNGFTPISGNLGNGSVWPRKASNLILSLPTGSAMDIAQLRAARHRTSNLLNKHPLVTFVGDSYDSGNISDCPSLVNNVTTSICMMATKTSSTTMVVSATVGGANVDFQGLETCINQLWEETTWDDIDGIAIGVFQWLGVDNNCGWTLDNVKVSVIPEPAGFGLLVVALLGLRRR
jgi:hypothetical protein